MRPHILLIPPAVYAAACSPTGLSASQTERSARYNASSAQYYGWTTKPGAYTGPNDPQLARDVEAWQRSQGLGADGAIGPRTLAAMQEAVVMAGFAGFPEDHPGTPVNNGLQGGPLSPPYPEPRGGSPENPNPPRGGGGGGGGGGGRGDGVIIPPQPTPEPKEAGISPLLLIAGAGVLVWFASKGKKKG